MTGDAPAITIRRATPDDIDAVVRLRLALLREYPHHPIYGRLRADAEALARPVFASQLASGNEVMFLADRAGAIVALLRAVEAPAAPFLIPDRYCYVSSVYVLPEFRRQGILRRMLDRAVDWSCERGLGEMRLHSVGSRANASAAWDALGFEVVEQVRVRQVARPNEGLKSRVQSGLGDSVSGTSSIRRPSGTP